MYLSSSGSDARGEFRALEGRQMAFWADMAPFKGLRRRQGSSWEELQKIVFPRWGVIDLPSKQINDFFLKGNRKKLSWWPDLVFHDFKPSKIWGLIWEKPQAFRKKIHLFQECVNETYKMQQQQSAAARRSLTELHQVAAGNCTAAVMPPGKAIPKVSTNKINLRPYRGIQEATESFAFPDNLLTNLLEPF